MMFTYCKHLATAIIIALVIQNVKTQQTPKNASKFDPDLSLVVLDTDMGTDDAYALLMLLKAEQLYYDKKLNRGPKLLAVTCVNGNTKVDNVVVNVHKILNLAGRLDGSIPVYRGASKPTMRTRDLGETGFFGKDGMGDVAGVPTPSLHVQDKHAALGLVDLVNKHPGNITLLATGPLTNIGLAAQIDPEFIKKLRRLVILGGATQGRGNIVPGVEFNFWMDPEAVYIVLKGTEHRNDTVSILSWEAAENVLITEDWREKELGAIKSPVIDFLNKAEKNLPHIGNTWVLPDPIAAALVLRPELARQKIFKPLVVFTEGVAAGGIAVEYYDTSYSATSFRFLADVDEEMYKQMLLFYFSL